MDENATPTTAAPDLAPEMTDADLGFEPLPEPKAEEGKPATTEAVPTNDDPAKDPASPEKPETPPAPEPRRLWAKKYETPEAMEEGYAKSDAEATRLAQENAQLKGELKGYREAKSETEPRTETRQYTPHELRSWKSEYQLQMADFTAQAREARRDGENEKADKLMTKAFQASNQVVACDDALRALDHQVRETAARRRTAKDTVVTKAKDILTKLKPQLAEGSPLYNASGQVHQQLLDAGYPDNEMTVAVAVSMAAQAAGIAVPQSTPTTATTPNPQKVMDSANKVLRTVPQGAGASAQTPKIVDSIDDFDSDEKFMEFDRKTYGVNW